jgi:hypothetical protein
MRSFIICSPGDQMEEKELGSACSTSIVEDRRMNGFGGET